MKGLFGRPLTRARLRLTLPSQRTTVVETTWRCLFAPSEGILTPDRRAGANAILRSARVSSTGGRSTHFAPQDPGHCPCLLSLRAVDPERISCLIPAEEPKQD